MRRVIAELRSQIRQAGSSARGLTALPAQLGLLIDCSRDAIVVTDANNGQVLECNARSEALLGCGRPQIIGGQLRDWLEREAAAGSAESQSVTRRDNLRRPDGVEQPVEVTSSLYDLGDTPVVQHILRAVDPEEALQASESKFAAFMDNLPGFAYLKDAARRHVYVNRKLAAHLGAPPDAWLGKRFEELLPMNDAAPIQSNDEQVLRTGKPLEIEEPVFIGGEIRTFLSVKFPVRQGDQTNLLGGISIDITERKRAEAALGESERFVRSTLDGLSANIAIVDADGTIVAVNRAWQAFAAANGSTDATVCEGANYFAACAVAEGEDVLVARQFLEGARAVLRGERSIFEIEYSCHSPEEQRWFVARVTPFPQDDPPRLVVAHENITQRKQAEDDRRLLEQQLARSQKLEAIGQLASGVAHDINNLLTAIYGHVELLDAMLPNSPDGQRSLGQLREAAEQAAYVTRALLTFSHQMPAAKGLVNVRDAVDKSLRLLRRLIPSWIELHSEIASPEALCVYADETQLQQILLNLAVNARDAMPKGGRLTIRAAHQPSSPLPLPPGGENGAGVVVLAVHDTGCGIPSEVHARIFEPFFTTKAHGVGTGLGLAIVHAIVKDHGGAVDVQTESGRGSVFRVVLPAVAPGANAAPATAPADAPPTGRGELVLVAEDDEHVRGIVCGYLRQQNFAVEQAGDGEALLARFADRADDVALLLVDHEMPKLDGLRALAAIRAQGYTTPALLVTAHMATDLAVKLDNWTLLCRKPFQLGELARMVVTGIQQSGKGKSQA